VAAAEDDRVTRSYAEVEEVERRAVDLRREVAPEQRRQRQLAALEDLGDAERRHREDQPRVLREAAHERDLGDGAEREGSHDPDRHREEERDAGSDDQEDAQQAADGAEVALREVDDAVGAVDQHDAHGEQREDRPVDGAEHEHADRRGIEDLDEEQDQHRPDGDPLTEADVRVLEPLAQPVQRVGSTRNVSSDLLIHGPDPPGCRDLRRTRCSPGFCVRAGTSSLETGQTFRNRAGDRREDGEVASVDWGV